MKTLIALAAILYSTLSFVRAAEISADKFRDAVVVATNSNADVQAAARDLVDYVARMTGVPLKVAIEIPADGWAFVLEAPGVTIPKTEYGLDGFAYDVKGKQVRFAGETPLATSFAVSDFLERQGVRWYTPGPFGEVVPKRKTLSLPDAPVSQTPSMLSRRPWYDGGEPGGNGEDVKQLKEWARRNKATGGFNADNGHMWESVLAANGGRQKLFTEHPDWFGEEDGKRMPGQLCMTNPQVVQLFVDYYKKQLAGKPKDSREIFSICPDDGMIYCLCPNCKKLIFQQDPILPSVPDTSDLVTHFCNQVIEKLNAEYPNVRVCTYIYANFQVGPQKITVNPHVIGMFAPLSFGRYHYTGDPRSASRTLLAQAVDRFAKGAGQFAWYDYSFLCPDAMMPFTRLHMVSHDMPYLYDKGLRYWTIETCKNWPNYTPDYYLLAKMTWDVRLDQKKLLDEFYPQYFGAAGKTMRAYIDELIAAYTALPFSAGNKEFMGAVFTPDRLKRLRALMDQAVHATKADPTIAHRVKMFDLTLQQGDRYMAMRDAINRFDFQQAQRINEEMIKWFSDAIAFDRLITNEFLRDSWYGQFYGSHVKEVAEWTKDATILHKFPDEWPAVLEAQNNKSVTLKTYSACLAEQGYETYRGVIRYKQQFTTPAVPAGKKLFVLFAGFDDAITASVDDKEIGKAASGSFGPALFEIPATPGEHTLIVRVTNKGITELGTGGIIRPVCLIARDALAVAKP